MGQDQQGRREYRKKKHLVVIADLLKPDYNLVVYTDAAVAIGFPTVVWHGTKEGKAHKLPGTSRQQNRNCSYSPTLRTQCGSTEGAQARTDRSRRFGRSPKTCSALSGLGSGPPRHPKSREGRRDGVGLARCRRQSLGIDSLPRWRRR